MILKHVLSFFILFVFVGMIGDKVDNVMDSFLISFVLYCVFVFTMRSHYIVSLTTIAMLLVIYIVTRVQSDPNITQERQNQLKKYKKMLFIITTVLATLSFMNQIVKCMFIFWKGLVVWQVFITTARPRVLPRRKQEAILLGTQYRLLLTGHPSLLK